MTHSTVRKWREQGRYYFIITAKGPKWPLLFEPRFAIQAVTVKWFQGAVMVRVKVEKLCLKSIHMVQAGKGIVPKGSGDQPELFQTSQPQVTLCRHSGKTIRPRGDTPARVVGTQERVKDQRSWHRGRRKDATEGAGHYVRRRTGC